jgi:hypothetical protein
MAIAAPRAELGTVVVTASRIAEVSNLGDYKLYTLPEPTTVAANQTKQVAFLDQAAVRYQRIDLVPVGRVYGFDPQPQAATALIRLQNKVSDGLGRPLPGGAVTVFEPKGDGALSLGGQTSLKDTPVGQRVQWSLGPSDVVTYDAVQQELTYPEHDGHTFERSEVLVTVRNAGARAALVEVRLAQSNLQVLSESRRHGRDGAYAVWSLEVPAEGEATLRYRTEAPQ